MCLALPGINVVLTKSIGCWPSRFGIVLGTDNARAGELKFEPFGEFEPELPAGLDMESAVALPRHGSYALKRGDTAGCRERAEHENPHCRGCRAGHVNSMLSGAGSPAPLWCDALSGPGTAHLRPAT